MDDHTGWYQPRGLPHLDQPNLQSVTFRTADSIPAELIQRIQERLRSVDRDHRSRRQIQLVEEQLDSHLGARHLEQPEVAAVVERQLLQDDSIHYRLHAWVVMPTHVHVLFRPHVGHPLAKIMQRWKGATSHQINVVLDRTGTFWVREYFDRAIRDEEHFQKVFEYIERNPVTAGLCRRPEDWPFGSAGTGRGRCGIVEFLDGDGSGI